MGLRDLTTEAVLRAIAEFDRLGREVFLEKYGFAQSRRYLLRHEGRLYDSKAIAGVAHGYLPGQQPLAVAEFSGGVLHAVSALRRLGFEVRDEADFDFADESTDSATAQEIVTAISNLRPAQVASGPMLKQAVVLLWAIGRAYAGEPRLLSWSETVAALTSLLETYRREGERREGRPDYPIAALFHAGLWDLPGHAGVPPAHGDAALRAWFAEHSPLGGLQEKTYAVVRRSAQERIEIIEAITDKFLDGIDDAEVLSAVGLYNADIATDSSSARAGSGRSGPPGAAMEDAKAEYARWCELVASREARSHGQRRSTQSNDPIRLGAARRAVLLRSEGCCENPGCARPAPDITDRGEPVLEVDHVQQIADDGRDHPIQMIALCPNCHAIKTRGRSRRVLTPVLNQTARERHVRWLGQSN